MAYAMVLDSLSSLEEKWQELLATGAANYNIFLTPQWQKAWWQVFGSGHELLFLSVHEESGLAGIAPMMRRDNRLSFIGSSDVCDYMDFIVRQGREGFVFPRLLDYLESLEWNTLELESLLPHSPALSYLAPLARQRGYQVQVAPMDVSPQLFLPPSWEEYLARLKAKDRHELRRKLRRLEQTKATRGYTITDNKQLPRALEGFFELFRMSGSEKARFMTDQRRVFFETMVSSLAEKGGIRLSFLEVGGVRAAACLCFDYKNEVYLYNSAYDPAYAPLSVSLLLKVFCIRDAINDGKKRFDFLRGSEPYKYDLGGQDVPVYRCVISRS
jgi:CelD/BcsL family acetyltransferase involved in cellulose biosynthesis